jgi:hypothetical protein
MSHSKIDLPFKLVDLRGEEVVVGDTIVISRVDYRTPILSLSLVTEIRNCPKTVRVYYKAFRDRYNYESYLTMQYAESGVPSNQLMKIDNIEFNLNQGKFAKLFVAKSEFETANPKTEEVSDEE